MGNKLDLHTRSRVRLAAALAAFFGVPLAVLALGGLLAVATPVLGGAFAAPFTALVTAGPLVVVLVLLRATRSAVDVPPGVVVTPEQEPALWRVVRDAGSAVGARAPKELRITTDTEVAVHRHMGRLVLVVGAPWAGSASEGELTVAVAHALAVARLGGASPWRARVDVLVEGGSGLEGRAARLLAPALSPAGRLADEAAILRECAADRLCVAAFGLPALEALVEATHDHRGFAGWFAEDVAPCLADGFRPPVLAGWDQALRRIPVDAEAYSEELVDRTDAAALWACPPRPLPGRTVDLQTPAAAFEHALLATVDAGPRTLVDVEWHAVGGAVWLPRLRGEVAGASGTFGPFALRDAVAGVRAAHVEHGVSVEVLDAALVLAIADGAGATLHARPGLPFELTGDGWSLTPGRLAAAMLDQGWDAEGWAAFLAESDAADVRVGELTLPASAEARAEAAPPVPTRPSRGASQPG